MFCGIDPSQRNVGLCFRKSGAQSWFHQIQPETDILSSGREIQQKLLQYFRLYQPTVFALEKQMPNATITGPLLFYIQMVVLGTIHEYTKEPKLVWPLPIQLRSYLKKRVGADISSKGTVVAHFKETENYPLRISSHCVEAFYLTRLAEDVLAGVWNYKLSEKELKIVDWKVINGE